MFGNAKSGTFAYDGTEKSVSGFKTLDFIVNGNEFTVSGLNAGDSGNLTLWPVLCAVGLAGAAGSIVHRRRKNS